MSPVIDAQPAIEAHDFSVLAVTRVFDTQPMRGAWSIDARLRVEFLDTGVLALTPADPGELDVVLSVGVHGNETAPIEIVDELLRDVLRGQHPVHQRTLVLFGHPPAMNAAKRFTGENLNRLFPTGFDESARAAFYGQDGYERARANTLRRAVDSFFAEGTRLGGPRQRVHYDMHTAIRASVQERFAVLPNAGDPARSVPYLARLAASGLTAILLNEEPATTFSNYSFREHGAHAFTVELGAVRPFGQNDLPAYDNLRAVLSDLLANRTPAASPYAQSGGWPAALAPYEIRREIVKRTDEFRLCFADDVPNFTPFRAGELLAVDADQEHRATQDGEVVIFPNSKVAIGQRAALIAAPVAIRREQKS